MASRIQVAKARKDFAGLMERSAKGERIKVTRYGRTLAAIIPKADLEKLEDCEDATLQRARTTKARRLTPVPGRRSRS
jgi:prevent-host-death family protein